MTRLPMKLTTSAIALAIAAVCATPALADPTPECNDSGVGGTECGTDSDAADFATAVGNTATASGEGSVAVGHTATASGFVAVAIGQAALASGDNSTATGFLANATGTGSTANGAGAFASGENSVATGINSSAAGVGSIATGANSVASEDGNIAIGENALASGARTTAIGTDATATDEEATAVGYESNATGFHSTAIGALADATAIGSTAIGWDSDATGARSTALGNSAEASGDDSTALGRSATATASNSVAIGVGSVADQDDTVSIGTVGGERRIVNVAAGIDDTDAANVGQLNTMGGALTAETNARIAGDALLTRNLATESSDRINADNMLRDQIDDLDFDLRRNSRDARAGTSAALAAAALPQAMDPGRSMISGGVGAYRGRAGFAVGGSHRFSNGSAIVKVGVTYDSSEKVGANAGVGFQF